MMNLFYPLLRAGVTLCLLLAAALAPVHAYPATSILTDHRAPETIQLISAQRWFQGGTLHRATLREWLRASRRNQIATAADLSVHFLGEPTVIQLGMDAWRLYATSLVTSIMLEQ